MAVKKKSKKKTSKKKSIGRTVKKSVKKDLKSGKRVRSKSMEYVVAKDYIQRRQMDKVIKNLLLFAILFIASFLIYSVSSHPIYEGVFLALAMIFGFVALAFIISFLLLIFIRLIRNN